MNIKWTLIFPLAISAITPVQSASIASGIRFEGQPHSWDPQTIDPNYPLQTTNGPTFNLTWFASSFWGTSIVSSAPNEQIFDLILTFERNPNQRPTIYEYGPSGTTYHGSFVGTTLDSMSYPIETWTVSWATEINLIEWKYLNSTLSEEKYLLTGTATISVISSNGQYDIASYPYTYMGVIPETSTSAVFLLSVFYFAFRRQR